jgi:lipopolysaccharide export system protein LptC
VLLAYLFLSPLQKKQEISFLLDKNKVETAKERLRLQQAQYRGQDNQGRPFSIDAAQAVQASSSDPVVEIGGMAARIALAEGLATIEAERGRYNMTAQKVDIPGSILVKAPDGYQLDTRGVSVDFNTRIVRSAGRVEGRMKLGSFSADRMVADIGKREVQLNGRARLHIVQGGLR